MSQTQLFVALLMTALMTINGTREIRNGHPSMGAMLIAVPICGWVSIWMTP